MTRKQTRRSVSLRPERYDQVKTYCTKHGISMSQFMEDRFAEFIVGIKRRAEDTPDPEPAEPPDAPKEFRPSGVEVVRPAPYKKPPIRGGGVHEF